MTDLLDLDAVALADLVRAREISPVEVVERSLLAIEERDGAVHSVVITFEDEARKAAEEAERAVASGDLLGPLHGVPVTIKEPIWVEGAPATNGSRALKDFCAPRNALERAARITIGEYLEAQLGRSRVSDGWERFFDNCDVLITPATAIPAFKGVTEPKTYSGQTGGQPSKVAFAAALIPANLTGQPALAIPSFMSNGLPVGLQLVAARTNDDVLVRVGQAYEELRGPFPSPPANVVPPTRRFRTAPSGPRPAAT